MRPSLYNFVAQSDAQMLAERLIADGYALRRFDGSNVHSGVALWEAASRQFGIPMARGWDGFADYLWNAILPNDDEGEKVALLWEHAECLATSDLGAFALTLDTLATIGRGAHERGLEVVTFYLGDGPSYRSAK